MKQLETFLTSVRGKTIHIIGMTGAEGSSIASFFLHNGVSSIQGHDFIDAADAQEHFFRFHDWMTQDGKEKFYKRLFGGTIPVHFKDSYLSTIGEEDIIFVPQSWFRYTENKPLQRFFHDDHSPLETYRDRIFSLTKLYLMLFPGKTIGVTGSNGKSTTTAIIGHILQHAFAQQGDRKLFWGGNDRRNQQPLDIIGTAREKDVLLLEISNRQLVLKMGISPHMAVITNVVINHLDDHGSFAKYIDAKKEIFHYQSTEDTVFLNQEDEQCRTMPREASSHICFFGSDVKGYDSVFVKNNNIVVRMAGKESVILPVHDIRLPGEHNIFNVLAACGVAFRAGIVPDVIRQAVSTFMGLPYRLELVKEVKGVSYYNDSAGCNPLNIPAAIRSFTSPMILIAGGYRAVMDPKEFYPTAEAMSMAPVKKIILIGSVQDVMEEALLHRRIDPKRISKKATLSDAVHEAYQDAVSGDIVILAPGCESFGEFADYRDRGERYKQYVSALGV